MSHKYVYVVKVHYKTDNQVHNLGVWSSQKRALNHIHNGIIHHYRVMDPNMQLHIMGGESHPVGRRQVVSENRVVYSGLKCEHGQYSTVPYEVIIYLEKWEMIQQ